MNIPLGEALRLQGPWDWEGMHGNHIPPTPKGAAGLDPFQRGHLSHKQFQELSVPRRGVEIHVALEHFGACWVWFSRIWG